MAAGLRGLGGASRALRISLAGLAAAWRVEEAFRTEVVLCAVLVPLGLWLGDSGTERALLVGVLLLVLVAELVNSALEVVFERFGDEHHPLTGMAKDMGSAAVFVAMMLVLATWALVLI